MYIPESTMFLLEKEKFTEARKDIEYLLRYNKASDASKIECLSLLERFETKKKSVLERELKKQ
jgi:hypothetical protein